MGIRSKKTQSSSNYRTLLRDATRQIRALKSELNQVTARQTEAIAIVGMDCRFPGSSNSPEAYWDLLSNGRDAMGEIPGDRWDVDAYYSDDRQIKGKMYTRQGGFIDQVDQFDPKFFGISPREAIALDPQQRLLLEVSYTALEHAGQAPFELKGSKTGVFVGLSFDDYAQFTVRSGDVNRIDAHSSLGNTRSIAAGRIAYVFGLQGPTMQLDTTCSSSLLAVHLACESLRRGESNLALAGGVNLMLSPEPMIGFCKLQALATDGRCKTFDQAADGYGRGEGCGIVVLKRLSDALAAGDRILATVRGSAVNHDGVSNGLTAPNGQAQTAVIRGAIANAGVHPSQIQYVEAHGTGTSLGDPIELTSLDQAVRRSDEQHHNAESRTQPLWVGSAKTNVGHLEAAAGMSGLMKVILALQHRQIPPHLNFDTPSSYIPWDRLDIQVPTQLEPWPELNGTRLAGISSFGMSGTNVHLVIEDSPQSLGLESELESPVLKADQEEESSASHLLTLSARSEAALNHLIENCDQWVTDNLDVDLVNLCFTANQGRSHFNHRQTFVFSTAKQLQEQLNCANKYQIVRGVKKNTIGLAPKPKKIVFLFTGQGSQYVEMGLQLYQTQPVFRQSLDRCAELLKDVLDLPLLALLRDKRIHQTAYAQPALFALEYSLTQLWKSWGIQPDGVMGHSLGEYVAACVAGVMSLEDGLRLVTARGRLMQALPEGGAMAAIAASRAVVEQHLPIDDSVEIAAVNGPENTVISGERAAVEQLVTTFTEQEIKASLLRVSHAFHSVQTEPMLNAFGAIAEHIDYQSPQVEFISNLTGQVVNLQTSEDWSRHWVQHVRQPVLFEAGMQCLGRQGYDVLIEIGPKPILSAMGLVCLVQDAGGDRLWLPSLRPAQKAIAQTSAPVIHADWETLLTSLAALYCAGVAIDWEGFFGPYEPQVISLPTYPFERQRYWVETFTQGNNIAREPQLSLTRTTNSPGAIQPFNALLGHSLSLAGQDANYFQSVISTQTPAFLNDHHVFDQVLFPAAGYCEIALAAAQQLNPQAWELSELSFRQGLVLESDKGQHLQTCIRPTDLGGYSFEIYSQAQDQTWQLHSQGQLQPDDSASIHQAIALTEKQNFLSDSLSKADFYQRYRDQGIDYGDTFRVVERLWSSSALESKEALAKIQLSTAVSEGLSSYKIHPILLDSLLQVAGATLLDSRLEHSYLPVALDSLVIHDWNAVQAFDCGWVYAEQRSTERDDSRQLVLVDAKLLSDSGEVIVHLEGLQLRAVANQLANSDSPELVETKLTDWLYQVDWQLQSLFDFSTSKAERYQVLDQGFLSTPSEIQSLVSQPFSQLVQQAKFADYQKLVPQLEQLSLSYIGQALQQLGFAVEVGETFSGQALSKALKVQLQQHQLWGRLLMILAEAGWLQALGDDQWVLLKSSASLPSPELNNFPTPCPVDGELVLLNRCGKNLAAVMTGAVEPVSLLFPNGDLSDLTRLYQHSPGAQVINAVVQRTVEAAIAQCPPNRRLRVLEIGAGTGGTTAQLLPGFNAEQTDYCFTDVSPLFLSRAQERFADYPFIQYQLLDIETSPSSQDFELHQFDLVIAANVLHATADLANTLGHVTELLALGGELVLLEGSQKLYWVDLIFGLTEGWWKFCDCDLRPKHPLLEPQQWVELLESQGFESAIALTPETDAEELSQTVFVAQTESQIASEKASSVAQKDRSKDWLIVAETLNDSFAQTFLDDLQAQEQSFELITPTEQLGGLDWDRFSNVVYLATPELDSLLGLDNQQQPLNLAVATERGCEHLLKITQTLIQAAPATAPRLYVVSQDAQVSSQAGAIQSALQGMVKVIRREHPDLDCTAIDVSTTSMIIECFEASPVEPIAKAESNDLKAIATALITEIQSQSPEPQVSLTPEERRVARLASYQSRLRLEADNPVQLKISQPGALDNLKFEPSERRTPGGSEVEIRVLATGLNFRDLLSAMGQYPGEAGPLGCECAGEIIAIGEAVTGLAVGQRVMALTSGSFGQYATVHRDLVIATELEPAAAATIPAAFVTAHYGLNHLAELKAGDRVLIHSAAGGVGQAAIQLAQQVGAEIYATASSGKWDVLRALGVKHIFNSRNLDFAADIQALTQGQGVDVVLNSLGGAFRDRSWELLTPQGRFIELGKGDIWSQAQVSQSHLQAQYFVVDLVETCRTDSALIQSFLQQLQQQLQAGLLQPLPQTCFALEDAVSAFRLMQQAKHSGKIVLTQAANESGLNGVSETASKTGNVQLRATGTYVITGGLSGLGLAVADWMVAKGARHLLLLSRSADEQQAAEQIAALRDAGATVEVAQADVTVTTHVESVLEAIAQSDWPLAGIVHGAGVLDDSSISQLDVEKLQRVMVPKVRGAWNLHCLTQDLDLDCFVLFSSAAALLGSPGQANHAAANAFLDGLAHYRHRQGLPALSINWGAWSEIGSVADYATDAAGELVGLPGVGLISPTQGLQLLETVWSEPVAQIGAIPMRWPRFLAESGLVNTSSRSRKNSADPFFEAFQHRWAQAERPGKQNSSGADSGSQFLAQLEVTEPEQRRSLLETHLYGLLSQTLGFDPSEIDPEAGFFDLGMDSLTALEFQNSLKKSLGFALPATLAFDYPTVEKLQDYLADRLGLSNDALAPKASPDMAPAVSKQASPEVSALETEASFGDAGADTGADAEAELAALLDQKLADLEGVLDGGGLS